MPSLTEEPQERLLAMPGVADGGNSRDGTAATDFSYAYSSKENKMAEPIAVVGMAMRLPGNEVLSRQIEPLLTRPVGRPPKRAIVWYHEFWYQAASWHRPRRVVAKVEWHCGELFPRVGFIVTNLRATPEEIVHFYNGRGTAEQWINGGSRLPQGKYALHWTRLSCHRFVANQVRLALFVLAYNLGNFLRRLALPESVRHWSLRSLQVKLIKIGAKIVRHARQVIFQMAEVAVPRELFAQILQRIWALVPGAG